MLSAIIVGGLGGLLLSEFDPDRIEPQVHERGCSNFGGVLFGVGWAISVVCPGTAIGALGEGRWHALFVIVGMIVRYW